MCRLRVLRPSRFIKGRNKTASTLDRIDELEKEFLGDYVYTE